MRTFVRLANQRRAPVALRTTLVSLSSTAAAASDSAPIPSAPSSNGNRVTGKKEKRRPPPTTTTTTTNVTQRSNFGITGQVADRPPTAEGGPRQVRAGTAGLARSIPETAYSAFSNVTTLSKLHVEFGNLKPGERSTRGNGEETVIRVAGRIVSVRDLGKLVFVTIRSDGTTLQVCLNVGPHFSHEALAEVKGQIRAGDIVGVEGQPGRTKKGELSVFAKRLEMLAPYVCTDVAVVPDQRIFSAASSSSSSPSSSTSTTTAPEAANSKGITDTELKYRYRFLDLIASPESVAVFRVRQAVIQALRQFLLDRNFLEVETPMFHSVPCGANAKPFTTHHNCNDSNLFLRIAPELYLKQCVVGGLDRVFEIGKVFRNEDADRSHNPEFTSCEFYAAYQTYADLMPLTEDLIRALAVAATGGRAEMEVLHGEACVRLDLTKPFARVSVYDEIQRLANVELPPPEELDTPTGKAFLVGIMLQHRIAIPPIRTAAKLFDKLIDHFITDRIVEPTFVCDHPVFMSPLAKEHATRKGLSERFELFINGMEVCNSYSELNDPREQLRRFEQQLRDKDLGDDDAMSLDETFLKALQVGMPPTAGWGIGLDRVVMLLTKSRSIRDVILFPLLRPDETSNDLKRRRRTASYFGFNQHMTLFCLSALEAELQRRGDRSRLAEHVQALRRAVQEIHRRRDDFEKRLEEACAAERARDQRGNGGFGTSPCSVWVRMMSYLLCGRGKH